MELRIPYGKAYQTLTLPAGVDAELCAPAASADPPHEARLVAQAMAAPMGSPTLETLAQGRRQAVILCSDHTRPVPSKLLIPPLLAALRAGNPQISITLLIATGFHRATTHQELVDKFGADIVARERIVVHDCNDRDSLCQLGALPSGAPLVINRLAAQADLLLAEGFIEPHFFAGFSGGRKSVLPGVCGRETVLGNHCAGFIASPHARTGVLEQNPLHRDMCAAARMAKLRYILNVTLDAQKRVCGAVAGDPQLAHEAGCGLLRQKATLSPSRPGDIVITSNGGAPLDQNIYQAVKGLTAAEAAAAPGAVLITCAACADGTGGQDFYRALRDCQTPAQLLADIQLVPMERTAPDQWEVQILARILSNHRVILVCEPAVRPLAREMKLDAAASLEEAYAMSAAQVSNPRVTVIPDGVSVIVQPPVA